MDFLLGRFAKAALDGMNAAEIGVFERLIDTPDPDVEMSLFGGQSLGEADLDELVARLRRFHGLEQAD
jgi:succinate dehydrogenase flavin-adding protein (antitoxin of CptAB toxin-antitoxin module)